MEETIRFLGKLLECTSGLSLGCVPYTEIAISDFLKNSTDHIFDSQSELFLQPVLQENAFCKHSILDTITYFIYSNKQANAVLFLGPVLTKPFSREDLLRTLEQNRFSGQMCASVLEYCAGLPVISEHILYQAGDLIVRYLTGQKKAIRMTQETARPSPEKLLTHQAIPAEDNIVKMRQVESRYEYSNALTDAIKQGNLSLALHMIGQASPTDQTDVRNANPLRNAQNYCIVLNTQLRHALGDTGVHPYQVDMLSHEIGLEIEQLKSTAEVSRFFPQIIRRYCRLVQEHDYPNLKPLINLTVTYIKEHLADNLTVKDAAKALTVNANYLSTLFHKEMGISFIDFVNKERTEQAAALLTHTNLQIQQIASAVGYNNTSYFAKQFVRFQGISPSQYKQK